MSWYERPEDERDDIGDIAPDTDEEISELVEEIGGEDWVDWIEDNPGELIEDEHIRSEDSLPENAEMIHHFPTIEDAINYVNGAPGSENFLFIVVDEDGGAEVYRGYE